MMTLSDVTVGSRAPVRARAHRPSDLHLRPIINGFFVYIERKTTRCDVDRLLFKSVLPLSQGRVGTNMDHGTVGSSFPQMGKRLASASVFLPVSGRSTRSV